MPTTLSRRLALMLPALLVPQMAEAHEPTDNDCTPLYRIALAIGGPETLLHSLAVIHDDFQLGRPQEVAKGVWRQRDAKSFRWAEQIQAVLREAGHPLPVEYQQMVDRLKIVERTGKPVVFTYTTQARWARTGEPHWVPDTQIEMLEPVARQLPIRKGAEGWEADLPQGVEVVVKISSPYKSPHTDIRMFEVRQYNREGKVVAFQVTNTDPKDENQIRTRDWRDGLTSLHPITEPFPKRFGIFTGWATT